MYGTIKSEDREAAEDCRNRTGCVNVSLNCVSKSLRLTRLHVTYNIKQEKLEIHVCRYTIMGVVLCFYELN